MAKTIGYMVTWTTYGTWLQGEKKGYVKDVKVRGENVAIKKDCEKKLKGETVRLGRREKEIVKEAIIEAAKRFKQKIHAIAVHSNHVHIVCEYIDVPIKVVVGYYKTAGRVALQESGYNGKVWTRGYDKRFCFDETALRNRIKYVERQGE
jgi:REP element-mobilizing transposase RayT